MHWRLTCFLAIFIAAGCDDKSPTGPSATLIVGQGGTFTTIQSAVNAAKGGETIEVRSGTYGERVLIDRPVTLRGAQAVLDGRAGGLDGRDIGIRVLASNVTISGFIVQNFERGIQIEGGSRQQILNNEIRNNTSKAPPPLTPGRDYFEGIVLQGARQVEIAGNNVHDNGAFGLYFAGASGESVVRGNRFVSNSTQMLPGCLNAGIFATGDNQIIDNDISFNSWGIYADFGFSGGLIRQNRIHGNVRSGIYVIGSNNRIEQNDATGNSTIIRMLPPPGSQGCPLVNAIGYDLFDFGTVSNTWSGNLGIANFTQPSQARLIAPIPLLHRRAL